MCSLVNESVLHTRDTTIHANYYTYMINISQRTRERLNKPQKFFGQRT